MNHCLLHLLTCIFFAFAAASALVQLTEQPKPAKEPWMDFEGDGMFFYSQGYRGLGERSIKEMIQLLEEVHADRKSGIGSTIEKENQKAEQGVALNTCPAASSIRHDHYNLNPLSKPRPRAGVRGL